MHVNRWLVAALVVAVAVAGTLGGLRYLDHRQTPDERAVAELVAAYDRAWNTGDTTALLATMTPAGSLSVVPITGQTPYGGTYAGVELADFATAMHGGGLTVTVTGPLVIVSGNGTWTAAQPVRFSYRVAMPGLLETRREERGWDLFTVVDDRGVRLISKAVWLPSN